MRIWVLVMPLTRATLEAHVAAHGKEEFSVRCAAWLADSQRVAERTRLPPPDAAAAKRIALAPLGNTLAAAASAIKRAKERKREKERGAIGHAARHVVDPKRRRTSAVRRSVSTAVVEAELRRSVLPRSSDAPPAAPPLPPPPDDERPRVESYEEWLAQQSQRSNEWTRRKAQLSQLIADTEAELHMAAAPAAAPRGDDRRATRGRREEHYITDERLSSSPPLHAHRDDDPHYNHMYLYNDE